MVAATVEWSKLLQVIWVSLIAGIGVTLVYSLIIFGGARAADARRDKAAGPAAAYGAMTAVALLVFLGGLVFGVAIILNK